MLNISEVLCIHTMMGQTPGASNLVWSQPRCSPITTYCVTIHWVTSIRCKFKLNCILIILYGDFINCWDFHKRINHTFFIPPQKSIWANIFGAPNKGPTCGQTFFFVKQEMKHYSINMFDWFSISQNILHITYGKECYHFSPVKLRSDPNTYIRHKSKYYVALLLVHGPEMTYLLRNRVVK